MVKFLVAHALTLEEKPNDLLDPTSEGMGSVAENIHFERSRVTQSIIMDMQGA